MVTTTPPATYLARGVTDLNRRYLWSKLTEAEQGKYLQPSSATSTTGSASGTSSATGTTSTTTTAAKRFVSLGATGTALSSSAFTDRIDMRSATRSSTPSSETLAAFSSLWASDDLLHKQLGTMPDLVTGVTGPLNGGAIFVTARAGTVANAARPYDGSSGLLGSDDALLKRGQNPYGYFSTDPARSETPFVQTATANDGSVTETAWSEDTGKTYAEWLKTAKYSYDQYETLVSQQQNALLATFGGVGAQAVLGFDVNNNGYLDSERELFGFDGGPSITNIAPFGTEPNPFTITSSSDPLATETFTFLTNGRLTGDPLDSSQSAESRALNYQNYRRFMVLSGDGRSTSVLQSQIGNSAAVNQYVAVQSMLTFDSGGASLTTVAQNGFNVTA